ncbi:MAG: alpha/beta hydrolase [Chloroflexota bacterium]|nr:alpha/beta hydrolase [Chloroflexota bacterium]
MQPYDYVKGEQHFSLRLKESKLHWCCHDVTFNSAHPNRYQKDNTAHGEYYVPSSGNCFPLVILLHGLGALGERNPIPCKLLARDLAKLGIASFVLELVLPARETAKGKKEQPYAPRIEDWLELCQVMVINARQVIDWAETRNELDDRRVAMIGISIGGITSAISMAVDKRIMACVLLVTGGNMEKITWRSKNDAARISHKCTESQCHEIYSQYPRYLADVEERGIENVTPAKECFWFDPLSFTRYLRGRPLLMINAEWDDSMPRDSALEFWEACGRPRIVWLPENHNTIFRRYHSIIREATTFIDSTFGIGHKAYACPTEG